MTDWLNSPPNSPPNLKTETPLIEGITAQEIQGLDKVRLELQKKHGMSLSSDDPVLLLWLILQAFEDQLRQGNNALLDHQRERMESILSDATDKLNLAVQDAINSQKQELQQNYAFNILASGHAYLTETKSLVGIVKKIRFSYAIMLVVQALLLGALFFVIK